MSVKWLLLSAGLFCFVSAADSTKEATGARRASVEVCTNVLWHDTDGDGCGAYVDNQWCTREGKAGPGWDAAWGNLSDFRANGFTALTACCACGGGTAAGAQSSPSADRVTFNGCTCKKQWELEELKCAHSCCNPDDDPVGDWCFVVSELCEDSDWGYCRPEGLPLPTYSDGERHGDCRDFPDWGDLDGEGCAKYAANAYCTDVGGYGLGWSTEWGTFASYAGFAGPATDACCACGGGKRDESAYPDGWTPGGGTQPAAADEDKVRTTWAGCTCKKEWKEDGIGECSSYCCNPDSDQIGEWCKVEDSSCEEADWGYCLKSGLGTVARPMQDAAHCADVPGWTDTDGDGCADYLASVWCTATGGVGVGWHEEEWGPLRKFAKGGHTAFTACCGCGGGTRHDAPEAGALGSLASLVRPKPEDARMWKVTEGPCEMDESGCVTSGNFPKSYSPNERCQISVDEAKAKPIHVVQFETETTFDALKVNGVIYSGDRGPDGVVPSQTIFWGVDSQNEKAGWRLCPRGQEEVVNPASKALKLIGITLSALLLTCCCAIVCLTVKRWYADLPRGDGLGAGPTKVAARIGKSQESEMLPLTAPLRTAQAAPKDRLRTPAAAG